MPRKPRGKVRVIAGTWRGRSVPIPAVDAIRPTPDRVRETVFNWLQPYIVGAQVADLYAGTGILGIEALSRGAKRAIFIEQHALAVRALTQQLSIFDAQERAIVHQSAVLQAACFLDSTQYDIIFIDPPYDAALLAPTLTWLEAVGCIHAQTLLYVEQRRQKIPVLPAGFMVYKHRTYGAVDYMLLQREGGYDISSTVA